MFTDWQNPAEIAPVSVLRVQLRGPVTLGHVMLLDDLNSPVIHGKPIGIGDIAIAVIVFSLPPKAALRALRSRFCPLAIRLWGAACWKLDFQGECDRLSGWLSEQCGGPRVDTGAKENRSGGHALSAPWWITKLAISVAEIGLSIEESKAMPVKQLNQMIAALSEARGDSVYITESLAESIERIDAIERKAAA